MSSLMDQLPHHPYLLLMIVCSVIFSNSLQCDFVFDDLSAIKDNQDLLPETPWSNLLFNDFWGTPMTAERSHKSYRPLTVATFRLNYILHGFSPVGYHFINLCLHYCVCAALFSCLRLLCSISSIPLIASLLFAVHPVHTEAVTGVVGRAELLSSLFYILSFKSYHRASQFKSLKESGPSLALCLILLCLAVLSKEQGITVAGLCCVYEVTCCLGFNLKSIFFAKAKPVEKRRKKSQASGSVNGSALNPNSSNGPRKSERANADNGSKSLGQSLKSSLFRLTPVVGLTVFLLYARMRIMGEVLPIFTSFDNPASTADTPARQLTYNYLLPVNSWLLLCPSRLCCDWTMGTIPLVLDLVDPRNLATAAFYVVYLSLAARVVWRSSCHDNPISYPTTTFALCTLTLPFLPASNLLFSVGFVVAERVLYLPSMGFCVLVAVGVRESFARLSKVSTTARRLLIFCLVLTIIIHTLQTFRRNYDWTDERRLFLSGVKVNRKNAKLFNNVGHALEGKANYTEALRFFKMAVAVQPDDIGAHMNVGRTHNTLGNTEAAEKAFWIAKDLLPLQEKAGGVTRVAPQHLKVFVNLGNIMAKDPSRYHEADELYKQAIRMRSDFKEAYINRGDILIKLGKVGEAMAMYETALKIDPHNSDVYFNMGVLHLEEHKDKTTAFSMFEKALAFNPEHKMSLFNSAVMMQETGDPDRRAPAEKRLKKLLEINERDRENDPPVEKIHFNLGMLAMDAKDDALAETYFRRAVSIKPDFRSALFNLALLLTSSAEEKLGKGNNDLAKPIFFKATDATAELLKHYPDHVKGLILMGDLQINRMKNLTYAEFCFKRAFEIDPNNDQALHNLCVVNVERGKLYEARKCLHDVIKMAPGEEYVQRHLDIVEIKIAKMEKKQSKKN